MPHFKCAACRTRLYSASNPPDSVGDVCPGCGALLERVAELSEVVGFRSITPRDSPLDGAPAGTTEHLADFLARRSARISRARLDAERWLDDSGSFRADAVALPRPER
jgi:hypothetical protein